jgi:hypothetical protein
MGRHPGLHTLRACQLLCCSALLIAEHLPISSYSNSSLENFVLMESEGALVDLCDVLPFFGSKQLSLHDLACLAVTNKQLKLACLDIIQRDASGLLVATVNAASTTAAEALPAEPAEEEGLWPNYPSATNRRKKQQHDLMMKQYRRALVMRSAAGGSWCVHLLCAAPGSIQQLGRRSGGVGAGAAAAGYVHRHPRRGH